MEKQKPKSIDRFVPGEIIMRVEPGMYVQKVYNDNLRIYVDSPGQPLPFYMFAPVKYEGCKNNKILARYIEEPGFEDYLIKDMDYDSYKNGWVLCEGYSTLTEPAQELTATENILKEYNSTSRVQKEN